ncbi:MULTISPECIES: serine/threonine-protein kinase [unclassified Nostoc]|uniref:serine/threonine protein kinase n=1 Tax=unclassified Nostoc TaxID=2593658 RepID=UPI002AD40109|nr:serine/threonine-protein kinase [Nostoc sp. DedQUE03]MDZ7975549.1 serine/threonine-protein kinase [Nostoc sp. DedQUE03]MDZ8045603.1 serine/threonine-protein kinase [Nostoc sp. DedQUE02]
MPWIVGQKLQSDKYEIKTVLGQGGFGITYKALHVDLNQTVVIKTPNEYLSHDPEYEKYIERFIQEGRILARLSEDPHPHIVGVIDLFRENATHCLVMDFVEGENLFEAVKCKGALPEAEIVPCIRQIGEALSVVHQAGLVHRDAHPGNIMMQRNGKAVLIDFGIAKEILPKTLSSKGIAGNEGFAPYEQMSRGSREPTVDVYCLAATLYYAVTGQRPTTSLARKLDNAPIISPKQIIPSISNGLNQAILKGMALEAKDRPQSMQLWLAMLETPKAMPSSLVEPVYRTEVVLSKAKLNSKAIPIQPKRATKSPKIIPWGWLVGVLLSYLLISFYLSVRYASSWVLIIAVAVIVAVAVAITVYQGKAIANAINKAVQQLMSVILLAIMSVVFWSVPVVLVVAVVVILGLPVIIAMVVSMYSGVFMVYKCGYELRKSFSKFHTFLILVSTCIFGLGLGFWLGSGMVRT